MSSKIKIGIVGCGAIGSSLAKVILSDLKDRADLTGLYDIDILKCDNLSRQLSKTKNFNTNSLNNLINKSSLVIEAASAKSSFGIAKKVLGKGKDIMVMSVGGIIDKLNVLSGLAKKQDNKIYIPSGAICGIDGLKATKIAGIKKVVLTTCKHPLSFKGVAYIRQKGIKLEDIKKDKVVFSGPAKQAVRYFPQNINVAAVLSLAGIGEEKTVVKIIASPKIRKNIHEIEIESASASIFTRTENVLHPHNPKTSYLAVLAAIATLKQILDPIKIGT